MDKPKMLSGDELVARGITKIDSTLPEVGLKDVVPNGSWLEQKQIQSALEARKHVIEVERIEKCGVLSHADWREDLMLAEVTKKAGGHWQYIGHNVGKQLFLKPEEALFLMEVNCLHLKYNDVTVSLQQAYSLLLRSTISNLQYKVYASLSRIGYKVYRHEAKDTTGNENTVNIEESNKEVAKGGDDKNTGEMATETVVKMEVDDNETVNGNETEKEAGIIQALTEKTIKIEVDLDSHLEQQENDTAMETATTNNTNENNDEENLQIPAAKTSQSNTNTINMGIPKINKENVDIMIAQNEKIQQLEKRLLIPCDGRITRKCFEKIPDLTRSNIVTVTVPEEQLLPRNVFLNNLHYVINLESIKTKTKDARPDSAESRTYSMNEEVNDESVRCIGDSSTNNRSQNNWTPNSHPRFPSQNQFRPQNFWRPNMNHPFNIFIQRPFTFNMHFVNRFRPYFRPTFPPRFPNYQGNNMENRNIQNDNRKRRRNHEKQTHLEAIKHLAERLRALIRSGKTQNQNVTALTNLIRTFNVRYNTSLHLTDSYEVEENVIETISLDDDEGSASKKPKVDTYDENLKMLKDLALKLKHMKSRNEAGSRHRRALSNLVKKFNKSYDAEMYVNNNYEVLDKRLISLDCSSDSDCIVEKVSKSSRKKLKNPFNILKRLSEKQNSNNNTSTSQENGSKVSNYQEFSQRFGINWVPKEDDFGRAEVPSHHFISDLIDTQKDEFLFDFIKSQPFGFDNWLEAKIAFLKSFEETRQIIQNGVMDYPEINSIITPDDCTDMSSVLKKLSVIKSNQTTDAESSLTIDYDVYNRDVQNFRKTNRPKPHFHVVCVSESSNFPSGKDVASLHARYSDMTIVFAVVGTGSISFLQINPADLPVYIPCTDLT